MFWLCNDFKCAWKGCDPFEKIETLQGKVYRQLEARKTLQFEQYGKSFFIKIHQGVGWKEILDNLIRLRAPVLGAGNEWRAIQKLESLGVKTMTAVAYGQQGSNPAHQKSFIVTEDLINTISLEDLCVEWPTAPPSFQLKIALINRVADVSRRLHQNGVNHRDYYICHFLLYIPHGLANIDPDNITLSLIDLHRSQIRSITPKRWIIKDIAGLWFSVVDIGLSQRDLFRFIRIYTGLPLREAFTQYQWLWQPLERKVQTLHRRYHRKSKNGEWL
ncbi:MAG: lipopolysaccharide core heptose(I) kinase RfaP [Endozoicomonadaceae bacterium]|nr:lipopolysaccharide core heptose(I) kinase RfaP [Endozoicomonadaceae bacterium]